MVFRRKAVWPSPLISELSHHPWQKAVPNSSPSTQVLATTNVLSFSINLPTLDTYIQYVVFCVWLLSFHNVLHYVKRYSIFASSMLSYMSILHSFSLSPSIVWIFALPFTIIYLNNTGFPKPLGRSQLFRIRNLPLLSEHHSAIHLSPTVRL